MALTNCYSTPADELVMRYTDGQELWNQDIDTIFFDWCMATNKALKNKPVRLNRCDVFGENQV